VIVASLVYWFVSKNSTPASSPITATTTATISPGANELPVAVTHRYFSLLTKRTATTAYNLLSEEYRRHVSIAKFSRTVGSKPAVKLAEVTEVSKTDRAASVAVVFEDTDPAANQAHWKGNIDFVLESGSWRIDSMKGLYPASGRPIQSDDEATQNGTTPTPAATPQSTPSPSPVASPTPVPQTMHGIVHGPNGGATLHEQPFAKAAVVTPLKNGDRVEIDRIEGDWLHATTDEKKSGFVHKSKVKINP
jgi:hypothetical protein